MNRIKIGLRLTAVSLLTLCLFLGSVDFAQAKSKHSKDNNDKDKKNESTKGKKHHHSAKLGEHSPKQ